MSNAVKTRFTNLANAELRTAAFDNVQGRAVVERVATRVSEWADTLAEDLVRKGVELGAEESDVRALLAEVGLADSPLDEDVQDSAAPADDRLAAIESRLSALETTAQAARDRYGFR